ncbi:MAG: hypothetical protein SNH27_12110 [Rikenellaceae bacterium]
MPDNSLLELDRVPTLEELRAFFQKHDFTTKRFVEIDYDDFSEENLENIEFMKTIEDELSKYWEPLATEKGLKSGSQYYADSNPLIALQKNVAEAVATAALRLMDESPEAFENAVMKTLDDIIEKDPENVAANAEKMLHNAVNKTMDVMQYEELAQVFNQAPAHEDFKLDNYNNYRAMDFDRKWNHTRASMQTTSLEGLNESATDDDSEQDVVADPRVTVEDDAVLSLAQQTFWHDISEEEQRLLQLRMRGLSQKEIAAELGYKTHSAVGKKLQKLKDKFYNISKEDTLETETKTDA